MPPDYQKLIATSRLYRAEIEALRTDIEWVYRETGPDQEIKPTTEDPGIMKVKKVREQAEKK